MTTYSIAGLWRYPVKSMGGERVDSLGLRAKEFDYGAFACFGTNGEVTAAGTIKVGDTLTIPD